MLPELLVVTLVATATKVLIIISIKCLVSSSGRDTVRAEILSASRAWLQAPTHPPRARAPRSLILLGIRVVLYHVALYYDHNPVALFKMMLKSIS